MADDKKVVKPARKLVKAQHTGTVSTSRNAKASAKVHAKHGITGDGPKKTKYMRVKKDS